MKMKTWPLAAFFFCLLTSATLLLAQRPTPEELKKDLTDHYKSLEYSPPASKQAIDKYVFRDSFRWILENGKPLESNASLAELERMRSQKPVHTITSSIRYWRKPNPQSEPEEYCFVSVVISFPAGAKGVKPGSGQTIPTITVKDTWARDSDKESTWRLWTRKIIKEVNKHR